ncbi:uncharacterized protein J4E88_002629 [Alternaria novae-zelandiae]|uniref:uncharacterized protein n=1 Tax=Alternaria novae-zelandiae TaxID=430562 RepID=UPI0020C3E163|nr:uncharacterized protein J4E88_002629 [Alternaria novae-zelandiae]KAI4689279.1 hypothetical protein J4E88_002629 [Alternaria novae-zelandiae]
MSIPTASPRSAVEAALDLFFRARHDPSIQPSAWDDLVATFDEEQLEQLEDATSVLRRNWPRHVPYPNLVGFVRWQVEKAERRDKELDRREKEDERREREDERREREDERREKEVREEEEARAMSDTEEE